jgi:hypothetical protein
MQCETMMLILANVVLRSRSPRNADQAPIALTSTLMANICNVNTADHKIQILKIEKFLSNLHFNNLNRAESD